MSSRKITIRVDEALEREIERAARMDGVDKSQFIRDTVVKRLRSTKRKPSSFYDVAMRTGFIGAVKGGPKDLSTNKKYFNGFGK